MKKSIFGTILLASVGLVSTPTMAQVDIRVGIGLPPPILFAAPPELVVIPQTYVYVVPDVEDDIYFYDGWWWRPWEGRWYRSRYYGSGWTYYQSAPTFTGRYPRAGGMITGIIVGTATNGTIDDYRSSKFSRIGGLGNRAGIGKISKPGVSRVCNHDPRCSSNPERLISTSKDRKPIPDRSRKRDRTLSISRGRKLKDRSNAKGSTRKIRQDRQPSQYLNLKGRSVHNNPRRNRLRVSPARGSQREDLNGSPASARTENKIRTVGPSIYRAAPPPSRQRIVSMESAPLTVLSCRMRALRGKRTATPDL